MCEFYVNKSKNIPTGKSFWTVYQHPHQDRGIPDTDFQVSDQTALQTQSNTNIDYEYVYSCLIVLDMNLQLWLLSVTSDTTVREEML